MKDPIRVLVVDDDADISALLQIILESAGYCVLSAGDGLQALDILHDEHIDLVILDIMMPYMNGIETCRIIQQVFSIPTIIVTAKGEEQDVIDGLEAGAYDYMVKPFRPGELVARIRCLLKRPDTQPLRERRILEYDGLVINQHRRRVTVDGKPLELSPVEFKLLLYLMHHWGELVTKQDLLRKVWGYQELAGDYNLVEAAVKRLRKALGDDPKNPRFIFTVWGTGYRLGRQALMPEIKK